MTQDHPKALVKHLRRARTALNEIMCDAELAERAQTLSAMLGLELRNTGSLANVRGYELHPEGHWTCDVLEKLIGLAGSLRREPPRPEGVTPW